MRLSAAKHRLHATRRAGPSPMLASPRMYPRATTRGRRTTKGGHLRMFAAVAVIVVLAYACDDRTSIDSGGSLASEEGLIVFTRGLHPRDQVRPSRLRVGPLRDQRGWH